jgi:hypothetical protein
MRMPILAAALEEAVQQRARQDHAYQRDQDHWHLPFFVVFVFRRYGPGSKRRTSAP